MEFTQSNNTRGEAERAIKHGSRADIPLMTAKTFKAVPIVGGIVVDNLDKDRFLSWLSLRKSCSY